MIKLLGRLPRHHGIVYVDRNVLVLNKRAGELSGGDATGDDHACARGQRIVDAISQQTAWSGKKVANVHRIDRPVSGILVLALTKAAARHLSSQFRSRSVKKQYVAVVHGEVRGSGTFESMGSSLAYSAVHAFEPTRRIGAQTVLRVSISTGKKHQVRKTLSNAGFPIVGDSRYGSSARFRSRDVMLHALSVRCTLPPSSLQDARGGRILGPHGWADIQEGGRADFFARFPSHWSSRITGCERLDEEDVYCN